jgi:hypothetical protein
MSMRPYFVSVVGAAQVPERQRLAAEKRFAEALDELMGGPDAVWAALHVRSTLIRVMDWAYMTDQFARASTVAAHRAWPDRPRGANFLVQPAAADSA